MTKFSKTLGVFIFLLTLNACIVKKNITNTDTVIIDDTPSQVNTQPKDKEPVISDITEIKPDTIIIIEPALNLKSEYNVAIILPLFSDSVNSNFLNSTESDLEDFNFPNKAEESLSFIEGALIALESLDLNSKINIKIYDNEMSYSRTSFILNKIENENIDFIVGPTKRKNLKLVSDFAKKKDIMMLSPFSPSKNASNDYHKYIMTEPSIDVHFEAITNYIKDSLSKSHIKVMYPNTKNGIDHSNTLQNLLMKINDSLSISKKISYALVEVEAKTNDRRNFKIEDYLDAGAQNIVIVTSFNEGFVHSMLTSLNNQLKDFDIKVFGMPNWKESNTLRLDYFNKLNVHYSDSKWINEDDLKTSDFIFTYKERYKAYPIESAYIGYDIFSFLPLFLDSYGLNISDNISKVSYQGLLNYYKFEPVFNEFGQLSRIENKQLHIISYENFKLHLKR